MAAGPRPLDKNQMEWTVYVKEKLEQMPLDEQPTWKKRCVYRVPACIVTDLNSKAYRPQVVSFGPYHHGEEHLRPMEDHKERALLRILKRSQKPIECFLESLREVAGDLAESYESLDPKWKEGSCEGATDRFLELMITDGCFMLEILRIGTKRVEDYAPNDPIFGNHGKYHILPYIRRDMLMLENQLPMQVLYRLVTLENDRKKDDELINRLILNFYSPGTRITSMGKCLHVLDVFRKSMLRDFKSTQLELEKMGHDGSEEIIRSATEFRDFGIRFKKSNTESLKDISYSCGVLRLPKIVVDDTTESTFLNLIAFERFHDGAGSEVTSYIYFMNSIINNEQDVALLHARGIIQNAIGSNEAVAKLFNLLAKDVTFDCDGSLDAVYRGIVGYCKKRRNAVRAHLKHIYSSNIYITLSVMAAIILFGLTMIQTVYTVLSYYM